MPSRTDGETLPVTWVWQSCRQVVSGSGAHVGCVTLCSSEGMLGPTGQPGWLRPTKEQQNCNDNTSLFFFFLAFADAETENDHPREEEHRTLDLVPRGTLLRSSAEMDSVMDWHHGIIAVSQVNRQTGS